MFRERVEGDPETEEESAAFATVDTLDRIRSVGELVMSRSNILAPPVGSNRGEDVADTVPKLSVSNWVAALG